MVALTSVLFFKGNVVLIRSREIYDIQMFDIFIKEENSNKSMVFLVLTMDSILLVSTEGDSTALLMRYNGKR